MSCITRFKENKVWTILSQVSLAILVYSIVLHVPQDCLHISTTFSIVVWPILFSLIFADV